MSISMSMSIPLSLPSICSTRVTRHADDRHRIVCCLRCLPRISTSSFFFRSCVHTSYVRTYALEPFLSFLSFLSLSPFFLFFLSFLFLFFLFLFLRPGRRALPCLLYSPPPSRLASLNDRALWLARSRNTPIWSSN